MIDRASGLPAYRQVAGDLREKINSGEFNPGDKLPSERVLVDTYGVSRITIREAVGLLRSEGLVSAEHGKGVFIRPPHRVERLSRARLSRAARAENKGAFLGDAKANNFTPSVMMGGARRGATLRHAPARAPGWAQCRPGRRCGTCRRHAP